jgi:16S rRNA (cytosine1402-N4)-methyltransferase
MEKPHHVSVLLEEVVEAVRPVGPGGVLVDATLGLGGHTEALAEQYPEALVVGIDRDQAAIEIARGRLERFEKRVRFLCGRHEEIVEMLKSEGIDEVDGVLADLGVSSLQFDDPERGFSFRFDGPLDMRMGADGETAADLVARADERELAAIIRSYGEEPMARRIARAIVLAREEAPIDSTARLAEVIRSVKKRRPTDSIDPATQTFQAIRIAVNRELEGLGRFIEDASGLTKSGGRIAIISFHSLEDRIVKQTMRELEGICRCPPGLPVCGCGVKKVVKILTGRPLTARDEEITANPRARSAKLRIAEKL